MPKQTGLFGTKPKLKPTQEKKELAAKVKKIKSAFSKIGLKISKQDAELLPNWLSYNNLSLKTLLNICDGLKSHYKKKVIYYSDLDLIEYIRKQKTKPKK